LTIHFFINAIIMLQRILSCLTALTVIISTPLTAQSVYIAPSSNIYISASTVFSADSMVLIPSAAFNITGANSETKNASVTHTTSNPYIKRVYHWLNTTLPFSGTIALYYLDNELNGLAENTLTLNVHNGTQWNAFTTGVTRDGVNNIVTTTGLASLSLNELTLAGLSSPLPVIITSFNAACNNSRTTLNWQTAQESGSKQFEVQHSEDGFSWAMADRVAATGNSNTLHNYSLTLSNTTANGFYRIVEYDLNGRTVTSSIIPSSCSSPELFRLYPNPVSTATILTVHLNAPATINLKLYDAIGVVVKIVRQNLPAGNNQLTLDMKPFTAGMYQLSAQWDNTTRTTRIIKQ
jgi:hypothetical protein